MNVPLHPPLYRENVTHVKQMSKKISTCSSVLLLVLASPAGRNRSVELTWKDGEYCGKWACH